MCLVAELVKQKYEERSAEVETTLSGMLNEVQSPGK